MPIRNILQREWEELKSIKDKEYRRNLIHHYIIRNNDWNNYKSDRPILVKDGPKYRVNPKSITKKRRPIDKVEPWKKDKIYYTHKVHIPIGEAGPEGYMLVRSTKKFEVYERALDKPFLERGDGTSGEPNQRDFSLDRASSSKKLDLNDPLLLNPNLDRASRMINRSAAPGRIRSTKAKKRKDKNNLVAGNTASDLMPKNQKTRRKSDIVKNQKLIAAMKSR